MAKGVKEFFQDFYGLDETINKIVRYFKLGADGHEENRQVLYMVGPVGSGKSSLVERVKNGMIESGTFYALEDCPMHEEPLNIVPQRLREDFEKELGVKIEGYPCPVCHYNLKNKYNNEFEGFKVVQKRFSKIDGVGIGVVLPVDPNTADQSVLFGSRDISVLDKYPTDHPKTLSLVGAYNAANRGLLEYVEMFKNPIDFLHGILSATQEKQIKVPETHKTIYYDGVVLAHSNEGEWNQFKSTLTNEALLDRIIKIEVPYVLKLDDEVKIYEKLLRKSRFRGHIAPYTLGIASMFSVMSRMEQSNKCDLVTKMRLYNGKEVVEKGRSKKIDVRELKDEAKKEGMFGVSTRDIIKTIDNTIAESEHNCINPVSLNESLVQYVKEKWTNETERERLLNILQDAVHKEYMGLLEEELQKAFNPTYEEQAQTLFNNYLDHVMAFSLKKPVHNKVTKEELQPDIKFMESIEQQLGLIGEAVVGFRQDVMAHLLEPAMKGAKLDYRSYVPLKEAIEKHLWATSKDMVRVVTKDKIRDKEQRKKYDAMVETMIRDNGYCEHCCEVVLDYARNHLWRG